jgi:predicted DNA-binding transcriptional regulator AlpA
MVYMGVNESERLITLREAARRSGLSLRQLYGARNRRELATYHIGGWPRVRWSDVVSWIESRRRPGNGEGNGPRAA